MTPCLSSAPSSTGYCERRHRSVDNVKSVGLELKIWVVGSFFTLTSGRSGTKTYDVMFKLHPFFHWLLSTASPVCGQREIGRFVVQDLGSRECFTLTSGRSGTKTYDVMFKLRPFVHWLLSTASPVCEQRGTGRFWVQDLGSGHVERTLRMRRMRSSPYVAGRHCNRKLPTDACWRTLRTRGMHSSSCVAGRHSLDYVH